MRGKDAERWQELCAQAAVEQDSEKLMALVDEINRLLRQKTERLEANRKNATGLPERNNSDSNPDL